jgi:hypothetical protein
MSAPTKLLVAGIAAVLFACLLGLWLVSVSAVGTLGAAADSYLIAGGLCLIPTALAGLALRRSLTPNPDQLRIGWMLLGGWLVITLAILAWTVRGFFVVSTLVP